ncbi:MAG: hypothetical protein PUB41_03025 [bacterium]|nr:hypothetical protein [bacterium]MDD6225213.1 hypothetical protein [bacterium]MDY3861063.1 hypothetical protein [Ruminococcus sp.]
MKKLKIVIFMIAALLFCVTASSCGCQNQSSNSAEGVDSASQSDSTGVKNDASESSSSVSDNNNVVINIDDLE